MTTSYEEKISSLQAEVERLKALLTAEVARLDKYNKEAEEGFERYVMIHIREHGELSRMIYPAYYKTHPEALATLIEADKILGKPKEDGSDPQP